MVNVKAAYLFRTVVPLALLSAAARGDVHIAYESDIDLDPTTPEVIDIDLGQTATITMSLSALNGETSFCTGAFWFPGTPTEPPNWVVENGPIILSDFLWDEPFQVPELWMTGNTLPMPFVLQHFCVGANIPLTLATLKVTGVAVGTIIQETSPNSFANLYQKLTFTPESTSYTVNVIPEPATVLLLLFGSAWVAARKRLLRGE